ncbi:tRNA (cytidine(34)-2'-O)-methyltransferase [Iodidimonas gelatinilytica]|uniref:tRNA (cytidine(34)-2'-O)-methyltransferase n=1 Tax=Iodidimonas gelatinilytica TaxID=1236966 RepID=A0A5A7MYU0_9PROT|nr:tRNA (cytidine(34)-2'-O)-methyltransferase [Iodidimonas gelatinilytica]GER01261.1 tRNA (cytidine(34)-2'-O)-methyltransferase [Iodidimonas gelatinilytica]
MVDLALFQPDIPQNTGTILRMGACLGAAVHVIEPAGFPFSEKALRRAGMDYIDHVRIFRHLDWCAFEAWRKEAGRRAVLLTTKAARPYTDLTYLKDDVLILGQESQGVPQRVHDAADERVTIPMHLGMRSLNIAMAAAMVLGESLRQTGAFPVIEQAE